MACMALSETGEFDQDGERCAGARPGSARRSTGVLTLVAAGLVSIAWLTWRALHLGPHPVEVAVFATELVSIAVGLVVGVGMALVPRPRAVFEDDPRESFRFVFVVADMVGRTRATDLHVDLAASYRTLLRSRPKLPDVVIAAALLDGPRRLVLVVSLTIALLIGVAPMPFPPVWAIIVGVGALALMSLSHVILSGGRIHFGDRIRWSSSALGEVCSGVDRAGFAPRRWVGTVAAVVVLNLAIALRGMSDRWTHGLTPMSADGRQVTMLIAITIVAGGLFTLRTTAMPVLENSHLVPRRAEERTARASALGGAVAIGLIGLVAGILPGNFDAIADETVPVERISDSDAGDAASDVGALDG